SSSVSHVLPINGHVLDYTPDGRGLIVGPADAVTPRIDIIDVSNGEILHQIPGALEAKPTADPTRLVVFFDNGTIGWYDLSHDARVGRGVDPGFDIFDFLVIGARVLVWPFDGPLSELDLDAGTVKPFGDPQAHVFLGTSVGPDRLLTN